MRMTATTGRHVPLFSPFPTRRCAELAEPVAQMIVHGHREFPEEQLDDLDLARFCSGHLQLVQECVQATIERAPNPDSEVAGELLPRDVRVIWTLGLSLTC